MGFFKLVFLSRFCRRRVALRFMTVLDRTVIIFQKCKDALW